MSTLKKFLTIAVIVYAIVNLFFLCKNVKQLLSIADQVDITFLISQSFHIIIAVLCSVLLICGALRTKPSLLICSLILIIIRTVSFFWYFKSFYELTLGCDDDRSICPDDKNNIFFRIVFLNGEF